jgi:indolepyruvate ferredoxin oxidoreductase beta subunit
LVRAHSARFLLALEENEGYRNIPFLSQGASMYINTNSTSFPRSEVKDFLGKRQILYRSIPANAIAQDLGVPMSSNLALLGFFAAFGEGPLSQDQLRATIERISPDPFRDKNLKIFNAGVEGGVKEKEA